MICQKTGSGQSNVSTKLMAIQPMKVSALVYLVILSASILLAGIGLCGCDTKSMNTGQFSSTRNLSNSNDGEKKLIENKSETTDDMWYSFRNAVYSHDFVAASSILTLHPRIISSTNSIGETVLHFVAVENDIEGVAWLYSKGANINTKNKFGDPVIFEVASLGYKELFAWFVKSGANLHALNKESQTIDVYLLDMGQPEMAKWIRENYN